MKLPKSFKFSRSCQREGCTQPATQYPQILLFTPLGDVIRCPMALSACDEHAALLTLDALVTDVAWNTHFVPIVSALYHTRPVREMTRVRVVPIPKENLKKR